MLNCAFNFINSLVNLTQLGIVIPNALFPSALQSVFSTFAKSYVTSYVLL